ncbi:Zinc finger protein 431 [Lemmus lemmus]
MMQETYRNLTSIGYIWEHHNCKEHCQCSIRHARIERNQNGDKLSVYIQCVKAFSYDTHFLRNEKKTHTGEKHRESKQCGKAFAYYTNLRVHKRTHTGEKPYECNQCGKAFVYQNCLQLHKRTHTG